jgi:hypothetical protein
MSTLNRIEEPLNGLFGDKGHVQLPEAAKNWIARYAWMLALIGGVLLLLSSWTFWTAANALHALNAYCNSYASNPSLRGIAHECMASSPGVFFYVAFITVLATGILYIVAALKLKEMSKVGWDLLFIASLVYLVYGILTIFAGYGINIVAAVIGAAVTWFFLFQIRSRFTGEVPLPPAMPHISPQPPSQYPPSNPGPPVPPSFPQG